MKSFFAALSTICILLTASLAQQADSPKPQAPKKQPPAQSSEKPAESAAKPEAPAEEKSPAREASADKEKDKEEHFDMAEVPPVVTHHQITVDGKS